jgi:carboxypeptidase family protein
MTTLNFCSPHIGLRSISSALALLILVLAAAWGQENPTTGSIQGTVKDEAGAPIAGARVTMKSRATQTSVTVRTDAAGNYVSSDPLPPGVYNVRVETKDFHTVDLSAEVKAGAAARVDATLQPINPGLARVENRAVSGEFDALPINGRNFLDLAQLEPGVQILDGIVADPNKAGFFDLSIDDRSGRTTRLRLDGVDISDETVGSTTQNVPASGVSEVRVRPALPGVTSALSSAGEVSVITNSGSESFHGNGFYNFRDQTVGFASFPGGLDSPWQRNQFGGSVGGPIIKDKLFFYLSGERTKQDGQSPVAFSFPFNLLSTGFNAPFRETMGTGRLDWQLKRGTRLFYRFNYDHNTDIVSLDNFSPFAIQNNTPSHTVGVDFSTGSYTHRVRFGYSKFVDNLSAAPVAGLFNPAPSLNIVLGQLQTGPNSRGPQETIQRNLQARYDGTKPSQKHTFRFGGAVNRIETGGVTAYGALAPRVSGSTDLATVQSVLNNSAAPFPALVAGDIAGVADNPLNYPVNGITIFNGRGFSSEQSAFGFPGGGHFDTRVELYAADTFKLFPNLNVSVGVNYVRDTGRTDSDMAPVMCAQINPTLFPNPPCKGGSLLLDQFGSISGLGSQVRQPNSNFGPWAGIAWDPGSNGKTLVRVGGGLYYENNLFQNVFLDRRSRAAQGQFFGSSNLCPNGTVLFPNGTPVNSIDGLDIAKQICGQPIGSVAAAISDLQTAYQAATSSIGAANPYFVGNTLSSSGLLAPNYQSPRVIQMNFGLQREVRRGTTFSVDFLRSLGTHFLLGVDTNHVGDASFLDTTAALAAINATLAGVCPAAIGVGSSSLTAINCYMAHVPNASIVDFARHGLDSANAYCGGLPCSVLGKGAAAFGGVNPLVGSNVMYFPVGRSRYNGLQMALRTQADHPARGVRHMNLSVSYTVSRYKDDVSVRGGQGPGDQDVLSPGQDYNHPTRFFGPGGLDRTHQISFATALELPRGLQLSAIGHFDSPLPLTLFIPQKGGGGIAGEIFRSDGTGDGTVGDVLPGTTFGTFGRGISTTHLTTHINAYNTTFANQLTPAGVQLVTAGLFTSGQLVTLGAVTPTVSAPPEGNVGLGWLKTFDLRLARPIRVREGLMIEPSVSAFNIFNFANYDEPQLLLSGVLDGSPGRAVNNATRNCGIVAGICTARSDRVGPGSGVYALGAPRQLQFGLRLTF